MQILSKLIFIVIIATVYSFGMEGGFSNNNTEECQNALNSYAQQNDNIGGLFSNANVVSCETQVVAGLNFKIILKLSSGEQCSITLYKNLQGNISVNDIYEDTCSQMAVTS